MKRPLAYSLSLALLLVGCSTTGPKHVSASTFQKSFIESQTVAMEHFFYSGETNGSIYISRIRLPRFYYSKLKWQTLYTETNRLPEDFLREVRTHKPAQPGPTTNHIFKPKAEQGASGGAGFSPSVVLAQWPGLPEPGR